MENNPYIDLLDKLKKGEIEEIVVEKETFFTFREVWIDREDRTSFVGEAGLNGKIIYRYEADSK